MDSSVKLVLSFSAGLVLLIATLFTVGCETIEPGWVGVKVNYWGGDKGTPSSLLRGRVPYNKWTTRIYEFPTFTQNVVWTEDINEGSPTDEAISFNSSEGEILKADVALSYSIKEEFIPTIFQELRQDAKYITHYYMRSKVRDCITRHAGKYKAIEMLGEKREQLLIEVLNDLKEELEPKGFTFDMLAFVGKIQVSERVKQSISATIESSQKAIEAQNKVKQIEAEANQAVAKAKGEAEATLARANAEAEANTAITKSLSPELLSYKAMDKWDGKLPMVSGGGATPFIQLPNIKVKNAEAE